jgi:Uncharacterized membrane-associated protein
LLHRGAPWAIVSVRFLYGLRIAGPVLIGMAGVAPWRFVLYNAIGAALWAPLVTGWGGFSVRAWRSWRLVCNGPRKSCWLSLSSSLIVWRLWKRRQRASSNL